MPREGGKNEWMHLYGSWQNTISKKIKGSSGVDLTDWAENSLHAHTHKTSARKKGIFLSSREQPKELNSCRASGFSGCCAPGWSQRRRPAAGYLLLFSMRASLKANRSGLTERAQQAHSLASFPPGNKPSKQQSVVRSAPPETPVIRFPICVPKAWTAAALPLEPSERERRRDTVGTLPLTKYNPSRLARLFFPQRRVSATVDARRRASLHPFCIFWHRFPGPAWKSD